MRAGLRDNKLQYRTSHRDTEVRIYRCETVGRTSHSVGKGDQAVSTGWPLVNSTKRKTKVLDHLLFHQQTKPMRRTDSVGPPEMLARSKESLGPIHWECRLWDSLEAGIG